MAHGPVDVTRALTGSCNVFMYRLGEAVAVSEAPCRCPSPFPSAANLWQGASLRKLSTHAASERHLHTDQPRPLALASNGRRHRAALIRPRGHACPWLSPVGASASGFAGTRRPSRNDRRVLTPAAIALESAKTLPGGVLDGLRKREYRRLTFPQHGDPTPFRGVP